MTKKEHKDWSKFREEPTDPTVDAPQDKAENVEKEPLALDHPSYIALEETLTLAEQKAHEYKEKMERALAEVDNIRRRSERDVTNAHLYGAEKLSRALLPVLDSLEQAQQVIAQEANPAIEEGIVLTMKLFTDVLSKFGIKPLDPLGESFDPQQHEAVSIQVTHDIAPNTVVSVFQKGYTLHERVIRPARVVVSKEK